MSRPLRIEFAGALYHVTSRGDGQKAIQEIGSGLTFDIYPFNAYLHADATFMEESRWPDLSASNLLEPCII